MPQLVGQPVTISTMEKPLPSSWFWKAFRMAFFVFMTLAGVLQLVRSRYTGASSRSRISHMCIG